jgi:hypothetical protein
VEKIVWDDGKGTRKYIITGQQLKVAFAAVEQEAGSTHATVPNPASCHLFRRHSDGGFSGDPRCSQALDLLEAKRLPDGGFPAEKRYYGVSDKLVSGRSLVDWGGASKRRMNEWVTVDALTALRAAGRNIGE